MSVTSHHRIEQTRLVLPPPVPPPQTHQQQPAVTLFFAPGPKESHPTPMTTKTHAPMIRDRSPTPPQTHGLMLTHPINSQQDNKIGNASTVVSDEGPSPFIEPYRVLLQTLQPERKQHSTKPLHPEGRGKCEKRKEGCKYRFPARSSVNR